MSGATFIGIILVYPCLNPRSKIAHCFVLVRGNAVAQMVEALCYKPKGRGFDSRWFLWNFSLAKSFRPHYGPAVDSAPNRNEVPGIFPGGGGGVKLAGA